MCTSMITGSLNYSTWKCVLTDWRPSFRWNSVGHNNGRTTFPMLGGNHFPPHLQLGLGQRHACQKSYRFPWSCSGGSPYTSTTHKSDLHSFLRLKHNCNLKMMAGTGEFLYRFLLYVYMIAGSHSSTMLIDALHNIDTSYIQYIYIDIHLHIL